MSAKRQIVTSIDRLNAKYSQSPIVKGLIDGGLSVIPFLGSAITSALDTRSFQIYEENSRQFANEVGRLLDKFDETKIDKDFIDSDEFVSLLIEILTRNARTHEKEKIALFAKVFITATTIGKSATKFKEGFVRVIDELSASHILVLALIHQKSLKFTGEDKENNRDFVSASEIAKETEIPASRVRAYCEQMIRFGLLYDWSIGRLDYASGSYGVTDYGIEFAEFLRTENS